MNSHGFFKTCPMCDQSWVRMDDFLSDPKLSYLGWQPDLYNPQQGLFYFTHESADCGSTMVLEARDFAPLQEMALSELKSASSNHTACSSASSHLGRISALVRQRLEQGCSLTG